MIYVKIERICANQKNFYRKHIFFLMSGVIYSDGRWYAAWMKKN